jgi:hypothetical protein
MRTDNLQEIHALMSRLDERQPKSRSELLMFFENCKKCKIIDSHNTLSIVVIFTGVSRKYAIKIEYGQYSATYNELQWYKKYSLPGIKASFICGKSFRDYSYIVMSYIDEMYTLADIIFKKRPQLDSILELIDIVFEANDRLFESTKRSVSPYIQYSDSYRKFKLRMREASTYPFLNTLINSDTVHINGTVYLPPHKLLESQPNSTLVRKLFNGESGIIHGDLHIGNIVYSTLYKDRHYTLDPGSIKPLPLQYDGGKILQSIHSGYEQVMRGQYSIKQTGERSYELLVNKVDILGKIYSYLSVTWDNNLLFRSLFMEAMHFLTMAPHHAAKRNEATALYLIGVLRLNEVFSIIKTLD